MPNKIYLIRHGETLDNTKKLFQGWKDTELNEEGIKQANLLASSLRPIIFQAIYSSDLNRAYLTATVIAKQRKLDVIKTKKLREFNMGKFEGKPLFDMTGNHKKLWDQFIKSRQENNNDWKGHGGESMTEFYNRLKVFFNRLNRKHDNETLALVSHGGTKNRILELFGIHPDESEYYPFGNTSVTIMEGKDDKYRILSINDTSHLENEK